MVVSVTPASRLEEGLRTFELALAGLVDGVSQFHPNNELAVRVIKAEKNLSDAIEMLSEHQRLKKGHQKLLKESDSLDKDITKVLVGLSDCRRKLQPTSQSVHHQKNTKTPEKVLVDDLLAYATRITKFTHAPPGYNPELPENANFPWPSEDELRRGVVAMLSTIDPPKVGQSPIEGDSSTDRKDQKDQDQPVQMKEESAVVEGDVENHNFSRTRRRSSLVSYGERPSLGENENENENQSEKEKDNAKEQEKEPGQSTENNKLELDFFDPDEDEEEDEDED